VTIKLTTKYRIVIPIENIMTAMPITPAPRDIKVPNTVTNNILKGAITQHTNIENPITIIPTITNTRITITMNPTQRMVTVIKSISIVHKTSVVYANVKHTIRIMQ